MTKEIIIDGVDVSDCMYYEPKAIKMTCHEQAITKPCNTSPICYYKLLHKAYKNCERLEQKNERLKENIKDLAKDLQVQNRIIGKFESLLQEIKKIAENVCRDDCSDLKNGYCIGLGECSFRARKQIIDLITKAEEK